ncbi:MAG: hypothetical protein IH991_12025 [Planctomycetes bacterium]|nr:hypothetical protein [Planctomycetota bacterium]
MLGISQFAHEFMCLYCGEPNPAAEWRTMGDMVPYYCQREPGKHNLTMTCPHCDKAWYVVWDNNPGEIELLLPIGNEPQVSATTHDGASHAQGARLDPALPEEVDDEEDRDPQQEEIQNFASRLMSDDQSTRDEVIDTAREMATTGDDTGLRALEKAIKDLSCNQDCTFHTPGFHVQRSGDSEGARYEILRLAERKQLLNDPEHSQDLIARVGSADIHSVWQNVSETGGEDEYRAYQLLASHIVTHAELIKHGREVESAELDEDDEEYRLAPELDLPDTSTINVSADAKAFICVCKSCGTIYALGVNSVVVTGKDTLYLQGQKPGLFDADTYPPDFIGLIEGKESWLRKEPPPQVEPLPDDIAISMESRERRRWLCAKCQGVQEYRWPGRQERPMTADPVTSGESDILGPLAAYVERMVTPGAEVCDVCGIGVFESAGYLLTTRQVVSTPAYWRSYYRQHEARFRQADVMSYTEFCNAGEIRQACCKGIAAQTTPWMVCERCIGMFKVDRSKTRDYALKWWAGGKTASVR